MRSVLALTLLLIATGMVLAGNVNPFDTITQPFAIGGAFKRTEKKSVANGFACFNASSTEWAEFELAELNGLSNIAKVQLKNGALIALDTSSSPYRMYYWDLNTTTLLGGKESLIFASGAPTLRLSQDEKKLYVYGSIARIGNVDVATNNNVLTRIIAFDITTLPAATLTYTDLTAGYPGSPTTPMSVPFDIYPLTSGNILIPFSALSLTHYVASSNTWNTITLTASTAIVANDLKFSPVSGDLFAWGLTATTPVQTVFYKFNTASAAFEASVTLSLATNDQYSLQLSKWTVGDNSIYYIVAQAASGFVDSLQFVQQVTLGTASPVSLGTTRLTTSITRAALDNQTLSSVVSDLYYDAALAQLVLILSSDNAFQVYGTRDFWSTIYTVNYRVQQMGVVVAFNPTSKTYGVPYGGGFSAAGSVLRTSATSKLSCFLGLAAYYRAWSPNFAVYNPTQDRFVADDKLLSGNFDVDIEQQTLPVVNVIENSNTDGVTYVAGNFKTISGVRYNSIVARVKSTGALQAVRGGVLTAVNSYDYYDMVPGSITKMIRSNDNKYLFVAGSFSRAGDVVVQNLAIYNIAGGYWFKPESTVAITGSINAMDYDGTYLYVVGSITTAGKFAVKNAARYNVAENKWYPMNQGIDAAASQAIYFSGKLVTLGAASASAASFESTNLGVWRSNAWKAIQLSSISTNTCQNRDKVCTQSVAPALISVVKGNFFAVDASGDVFVAGNDDLTYFNYYATAPIHGSATKVCNFPKTNTVAVVSSNVFYEYNYDMKNLQHTTTRDLFIVADANVNAISAASLPRFAAVMIASIVAVLAILF